MLGMIPAAGSAAILRFDYTSQPLVCYDPPYCYGKQTYVETGYLVFDTSVLPGNTLRETTISLSWDKSALGQQSGLQNYDVSNSTGSLRGSSYLGYYTGLIWPEVGILSTGGYMGNLLGYTVGRGNFRISFDSAGQVTDWYGNNMVGGSDDPITTTAYDATGAFLSSGPGKWKMTVLQADPIAPVPLPAAGWLLLSGFTALAGLRFALGSPTRPLVVG